MMAGRFSVCSLRLQGFVIFCRAGQASKDTTSYGFISDCTLSPFVSVRHHQAFSPLLTLHFICDERTSWERLSPGSRHITTPRQTEVLHFSHLQDRHTVKLFLAWWCH